jgi:ABC-type Fe3+/spermidine/putrescine transport system ATPase subunit
MSAFLRVENLTRQLGNFSLGPITLHLNKNEYFVLLGPTGSGKSSLLHAIAGTQGTLHGMLFIENKAIGQLPLHQRRIGFVSQDNTLFPHLTVAENISFGLRYLAISPTTAKERLRRFLALFGLEQKAKQSVTTLSGGEQRKVAMARSLITEPQLLLLDEPLSMLDHNGRQDILKTLKMIHQEIQTTTLHVTHDRLEAWSLAQSCAVMEQGKILQTGSVADLFRKPNYYSVAEFLGGTNIFPVTVSNNKVTLTWCERNMDKTVSWKNGYAMLRPEHITLSKSNEGAKGSGTIIRQRDFGQYLEVIIDLSSGDQLIVHLPASHASAMINQSPVFLHWAEEDLHLFPAQGDSA